MLDFTQHPAPKGCGVSLMISFIAQFEYKTIWSAPLKNLPGYFATDTDDRRALEKQSVHALYQAYGYMSFNENKYGVLTMIGFSAHRDGRSQRQNFDILWTVGIILLSENTWFHCSNSCQATPWSIFNLNSHPHVNVTQPLHSLSFDNRRWIV